MPDKVNPGVNKLANTLTERMQYESQDSLVLDFGTINADLSLITNTFPVPLPRSGYTVCQRALAEVVSSSEQDGHTHQISRSGIGPGARVLVAWVQNEAVVIDIIKSAAHI